MGWHAGASGDTRMAQRAMASEALQALPQESSTAAPHGRDVAIAMFSPPLRNRRGGSQETPAPARPQSRLRRNCRGVMDKASRRCTCSMYASARRDLQRRPSAEHVSST